MEDVGTLFDQANEVVAVSRALRQRLTNRETVPPAELVATALNLGTVHGRVDQAVPFGGFGGLVKSLNTLAEEKTLLSRAVEDL